MCSRSLLFALAMLAVAPTARAQCYIDQWGNKVCPVNQQPYASQQPGWYSAGSSQNVTSPNPVGTGHCRITLADGSTGSGTLVGKNESVGNVITCSHLFRDSTSRIIVSFPGGKRYGARLMGIDGPHELALLMIRRPDNEVIELADSDPEGALSACGFGPNGMFRRAHGSVTGQTMSPGASSPSTVISCSVRPGDSGGAVLNSSGQLVGVVWGTRDGQTWAMCGQTVREFVQQTGARARQQNAMLVQSHGGGGGYVRPQPYQPPLAPIPQPTQPQPPTPTIDQDTVDKITADAKAEAVAAAKAEVSVLVKNEVAGIQPCGCGEKWGELEIWQRQQADAIAAINNQVNVINNRPAPEVPEQRPFYIRVRNSKTGQVTPYATVLPGQHVTLDLNEVSHSAP